MVLDYKRAYKDIYLPGTSPAVLQVPTINYVAVRGYGDPNPANGTYQAALGILYALSYTIKMSYKKGGTEIPGYFPYVVPPLEGLWWMADGRPGVDYENKNGFCWIAMIRLPEFVDAAVLHWAREKTAEKKKLDTAPAEFLSLEEGLCVQCMHVGPYDSEPETVARLDQFAKENGYAADFSGTRRHHEIYLSDPRRTAPEKLRTVLRHPVRVVNPKVK